MNNQLALLQPAHLTLIEPMTTPSLTEAWLDSLTARTLETYLESLRIYARWCGLVADGHVPDILEMRGIAADCLDFLITLGRGRAFVQMDAFRSHQLSLGRKVSTTNLRVAALRSGLNYARRAGVIEWTVELPAIKNDQEAIMGPTVDQVRQMVAKAGEHRDPAKAARDRALIICFFGLGVRLSELLETTTDDYTGTTLSILGKGRRSRTTLTVPPVVGAAIDAWLTHRDAMQSPSDALWLRCDPRSTGKLTKSGLYTVIRRIGQDCGFKTHPHALRHSCCVAALESGEKLTDVVSLLRHSSPNMTMIYAKKLEDTAGAVSGRLSELL